MRCSRCNRLVVRDDLIDICESYHPMRMCGWRCLACGNVVDPQILRHRMIQKAGALRLLEVAPPPPASFPPAKVSA